MPPATPCCTLSTDSQSDITNSSSVYQNLLYFPSPPFLISFFFCMFVPFLPLLSCHPLPPYSFLLLLSVLLLNRCLIRFYTVRNQSQTRNRKSVYISTDLLSNEFVNAFIHYLLPGASCSQKAMMIHLNLGIVFVHLTSAGCVSLPSQG